MKKYSITFRKACDVHHPALFFKIYLYIYSSLLSDRALSAVRDLGETVPILRALIATPSVNPDQVGDPDTDPDAGELRMAQAVYNRFVALGADEAFIDDAQTRPGRPNVMGIWRAHPHARNPQWLGLDIHLDTVAVKGMTPYPPFGGVVTEESTGHESEVKVHGRGACDTKVYGVQFACKITNQ